MSKILGITNDVTTCECCGRSDLKATIVIGNDDGTVLGYFGSQCATKYVRGTAMKIEMEAGYQNRIRREIEREMKDVTARMMGMDRSEINYHLRQQLGSTWGKLGLDEKMSPEARRDIYLAWKRNGLESMMYRGATSHR